MHQFFREYFIFNRQDQNGILVLLLLIFALTIFRYLIPYVFPIKSAKHQYLLADIEWTTGQSVDSKKSNSPYSSNKKNWDNNASNFYPKEKKKKYKSSKKSYSQKKKKPKQSSPQLKAFPFYIDELDGALANKLGLPKFVGSNIDKYKAKGGQLKKVEDLKKIYGIDDAIFNQLLPFIGIKETPKAPEANEIIDASPVVELKDFDPNQLNYEQALALGLSKKVAKNIENYLQSNGQFYKKEDLQKIYSMTTEEYERLAPYINIPPVEKVIPIIDINKASKEDWMQIRGIGDYLSQQIIDYKHELGGFVSIDQLGEVYGIKSDFLLSIKESLQLDNPQIKQMNINELDKETLVNHPYINWKVGNSIVKMRQQHGAYQSVADIKRSHLINDSLFLKLQTYLSVESQNSSSPK